MNHVEGFVVSDCVIHNVSIYLLAEPEKEFMNLLLQNLNMEMISCEMRLLILVKYKIIKSYKHMLSFIRY